MALSLAAVACVAPTTLLGRVDELAPRAAEVPAGVRIEHVAVGLNGHHKVGDWTPIAVDVSTDRAMRLTLIVQSIDPGGHPVVLPAGEVNLAEPGTHRIAGVYKSGQLESPVTIRMMEDGVALASRTLRPSVADDAELHPGLLQSTMLMVTLGQPAGLADFDEGSASSGGLSVEVVALDDPKSLPEQLDSLDAVDVLVVAGEYDEVTPASSRVIEDWVRRGGHLVLSVGAEAKRYRDSQLAQWIPIPVTGETIHTQLSGLESFSGRNVQIAVGRINVPGAALEAPARRVLVTGRDGPLLVAVPYGFGRITVLSVDLDRPPISQWRALPEFIQRLLGHSQSVQETGGRSRGGLTKSGISDLATQLHAVQDHFPAVSRISTFPVMGMLVLYMLLVGPIDYLVVHRLLGRPQLTWVTFPLLVVGAVLLAAWVAADTNGDVPRMNQLAILDADVESGFVRSTTWQTFYSPRSARYAVDVQPQSASWGRASTDGATTAADNKHTIWAGIPESSFGGMYRTGGSALGQPLYHLKLDAAAIEDLPVPIWGSKSLETTWQHRDQGLVQSDLRSRGVGRLSGTLTHSLPAPLSNWMLAYGNRLYFPKVDGTTGERPALEPNRPLQISPNKVDQRVLLHFLTGTVIVENKSGRGDQFQTERTAYDVLSLDPRAILRMLTFYQLIGGRNYANVDNYALGKLDMSELIELDRAVLLGWIDHPAAVVNLDGEPIAPEQHTTCVRLVLPVQPAESTVNDEAFRTTE